MELSDRDLVHSFTTMRKASLYLMIASVLMSLGFIASFSNTMIKIFIPIDLAKRGWAPPLHAFHHTFSEMVLWVFGSIVTIVGVTLGLYIIFSKLLPAISILQRTDPELSTARLLIEIGFPIGFIMSLVSSLTSVLGMGIVFTLVSMVFMLVGFIGMSILCLKIYTNSNEVLFIVAGILFVISALAPILAIISWILIYVGCDELIKKLSMGIGSP